MLLILPLPFTVRRKVFTYVLPLPSHGFVPQLTVSCFSSFISENPIVAKVQYWLKITFIFILILFIDSVNRVYRVQAELASVDNSGPSGYVSLASSYPIKRFCWIFLGRGRKTRQK